MTTFTREQVWTAVLGAWQTHKLAAPTNVAVYSDWVDVTVATLADLTAWSNAIGGTVQFAYRPSSTGVYSRASGNIGGIDVALTAHEGAEVVERVPAELDGALSALAAALAEPVKHYEESFTEGKATGTAESWCRCGEKFTGPTLVDAHAALQQHVEQSTRTVGASR